MNAFKNYFIYAFDFVGVCGRKEFWIVFSFVLALYVASFIFIFIGGIVQIVLMIISLLLLIPTISIIVRRLHDTDRSAKYLFWWLLPIIGQIIILIFLTERTKYTIPCKEC